MAINPYTKPAPAEFLPYDKEFLLRAGELSQKRADETEASFDEADRLASTIQGGYRTQDRAQAYRDKLRANLNTIADKLSTSDITGGKFALKKLVSSTLADPEFNSIMEDQKQKEIVSKQMQEQQFPNSVQDFYNSESGFTQTSQGERFNPNWYQQVNPGDSQKEFKPYYDQIKANVFKHFDPATMEMYTDDQGNARSYLVQNGQEVEKISQQDVYNYGLQLAKTDPNFSALQSINYDKAKYNQNVKKSGVENLPEYGAENQAELFKSNFLGAYHRERDAQPKILNTTSSKSNGSGKSNTPLDTGIPNEISDAIVTLGDNGKAHVRTPTLVAFAGGSYDPKTKESTIHIDDASRPVYLNLPLNVTGAKDNNDNIDFQKIIPFKAAFEQAKNKLYNDFYETQQNTMKSQVDSEGNHYTILPDGKVGMTTAQEYPQRTNGGGYTKVLSKDEFSTMFLSQTDEGKNIIQKANDIAGIDITDPTLNEKLKKFNSNKDADVYSQIALATNSITGDFSFSTDETGDNMYISSQGTPVVKGYTYLDQEDIEHYIPDYKKALDLGLIQKGKNRKDPVSGKYAETYKIPIIREIDSDVEQSTYNYMENAYSSRKDIDELKQSYGTQSLNSLNGVKIKSEYNGFKQVFNSDKTGLPLNKEINSIIGELYKVNPDEGNAATESLSKIYETTNKDLQSKLLYAFKLALEYKITQDPEVLNKYNKAREVLKLN